MTLPAALRALLWPASVPYQAAVRMRAWAYRHGVFHARRLPGTVLSVGNLTVGGTGKTPMVIWLTERIAQEGRQAGILIRGYRGRGQLDAQGRPLSDEVALLRERLGKKAQLGVGADRYACGEVLARHGVEWFVLDDGFQHLRLARDVDIVLVDATEPFGGGYLLPAGRLREPRSALARADIVVITRSEHAPAVETIIRWYTQAPIFYAQTDFQGVFPVPDQFSVTGKGDWRQGKYLAICAIGNSRAFFGDLRRWNVRVAGERAFGDHHAFNSRDAAAIERLAEAVGADALLCTEKDVFNLRGIRFRRFPSYFCRTGLKVSDAEVFWKAILATVEHHRAGAAQ